MFFQRSLEHEPGRFCELYLYRLDKYSSERQLTTEFCRNASHGEHDSKFRFPAHHTRVAFGSFC